MYNNIKKVNVSLSSKEYNQELNDWISTHKDVIQIYASYNNLINSYDYPAMYNNVIASGSNNNVEYKAIDINYKKSKIFYIPNIKLYNGNFFLSLITMLGE
jgi:glutamate dehydrogenase/leucine dehydrogenase